MKRLGAHCIMLSPGGEGEEVGAVRQHTPSLPTLLLPEVSHRSAGVSDECTHAPVHLVMRRRKDQERSRLRASFSAAVLRRVRFKEGG